MMASYDDWKTALEPVLPGAGPTAIRNALRYAAQTFYRRTRAWRVKIPAMNVDEGVSVVSVAAPAAGAKPVMIEEAEFLGEPLRFVQKPPYADAQPPSRPFRIWLSDPLTANLWPVPNDDFPAALVLTVSVYPDTLDDLPPFAATHHFDGLESGALARMYAQPNAPYTNPQLAVFHLQKFNAEVQRGKARVAHGNAGLAPVWSYGVVSLR